MKHHLKLTWICLALLSATASLALGQTQERSNARTNTMRLPIYDCRLVDRDVVVSGKGDDPLWRQAEVIHLNNPIDGQPGRYRTTARMLYNTRCLYIAFECEDHYVWGTLTERDAAIFGEECVEVFICPSGRIRQYYEINVSPRNTVFDAFILNGRSLTGEWTDFRAWKEFTCEGLVTRVWVNGELGKKGAKGWSAEYAIPFSAIIGSDNLTPQPGDEWRINFYRIDSPEPKQLEYYAWSPTGANDFHRPWCFGVLKFRGKKEL
jgi:Carbohydrate-binding family 9